MRNGLALLGVSAPERMDRDTGNRMKSPPARGQRGGFALGMIVGLLLGLALALGVALYVTKVPIPFVNKVPQRTASQDAAEIERNKNWDPNAPLAGKPVPGPALAPSRRCRPCCRRRTPGSPPAARRRAPPDPARRAGSERPAGAAASAPVPAPGPSAPAADAFIYFVQAGAYARAEDAEQQRAKLALAGLREPRVTEREQSRPHRLPRTPGALREARTMPTPPRTLGGPGIEAALVRVER